MKLFKEGNLLLPVFTLEKQSNLMMHFEIQDKQEHCKLKPFKEENHKDQSRNKIKTKINTNNQ